MSLIARSEPHSPKGKILKEPHSKVRKIAFVADFLPRKCGIAIFTSDLLTAGDSVPPIELLSLQSE
jgi:hypothetical protein